MKSLAVGMVLIFGFFIFSSQFLRTIHPPVWPDEAIYAEVVENVITTGTIKSHLWKDAIFNIQSKAMWNPPMFFYEYAIWQKIWGVSVTYQRLLVQIISFLCMVLIVLLLRSKTHTATLISLLLWVSNIVIAKSTRFARPEMFVLLCGLLGIFFTEKALNIKKGSQQNSILAGIAFGMAILNHLIGMLFLIGLIGAGLFYRKSAYFKKYLAISGVSLIVLLPWGIDIMMNWSTFIQQFKLSSYPRTLVHSWLYSYINFGSIPEKVISLGYLGISLLISYIIINTWLKRKQDDNPQRVLLFITLIVAWVLSVKGKSEFYAIYPLSLTIVTWGHILNEHMPLYMRRVGLILVVVVLSAQIFQSYSLISNGASSHYDYDTFANEIQKHIPDNASVFLSSIPDPYFSFVHRKGIVLYEFPAVPIARVKYTEILNDSDYIVYNGQYEAHLFGNFLRKYIEHNIQEPIEINAGGYRAHIFKLKEKSKRITSF